MEPTRLSEKSATNQAALRNKTEERKSQRYCSESLKSRKSVRPSVRLFMYRQPTYFWASSSHLLPVCPYTSTHEPSLIYSYVIFLSVFNGAWIACRYGDNIDDRVVTVCTVRSSNSG